MVATVIIESYSNSLLDLKGTIQKHCPNLQIKGVCSQKGQAIQLINEQAPKLVFAELNPSMKKSFEILQSFPKRDFETIFIAPDKDLALEAMEYKPSAYLLKPIEDQVVLKAIGQAQKQIATKKHDQSQWNKINKLLEKMTTQNLIIGVPTIEGFELLPVEEIVRCEGFQRCTRVVTIHKTDIISSYNIGKFRELLESYRFFATHKSHVINLSYVRRYRKEGIIVMKDGAAVPVSRRKRNEFLDQLTHL